MIFKGGRTPFHMQAMKYKIAQERSSWQLPWAIHTAISLTNSSWIWEDLQLRARSSTGADYDDTTSSLSSSGVG
jgi:hypothetical protein